MAAGVTNAAPMGGGLKVIASASKQEVTSTPFTVTFPAPVAYLLLMVWDEMDGVATSPYAIVDGYYLLQPGEGITDKQTTAPYITFDGQILKNTRMRAGHKFYLSYLALG